MNHFQYMLQDFGVSTEKQLEAKMIKESETVPCIICGKEMQYDDIHTIMGDPYCMRDFKIYKN